MRILLARDQTISLNGSALQGTREFDVDLETQEMDVTAWWHSWRSTLTLTTDVSIKLLIYWHENFASLAATFNRHPPQPVTLAISNLGTFRCLPTKIGVVHPLPGIVAWEVTLKGYTF